jgi:hypothetical protein
MSGLADLVRATEARYRLDMDPLAEWRRALELLADSPDGSTTALMLAHGFTSTVIAGLVDAGLATSTTEPVLAGGRPVDVTRIRITYRGVLALERRVKPPKR